MNQVLTTPIPAEPFKALFERDLHQQAVSLPPAIAFSTRTDFASLDDIRAEAKKSELRYRLQCIGVASAVILVGSAQAIAENDASRPVANLQAMHDSGLLCMPAAKRCAAEFYEPVVFTWTKANHRIRQAAKRYSENTHADY